LKYLLQIVYFTHLNYIGLKQYATRPSGSDTTPEEGLQNSSGQLSTEAKSTLSVNRLRACFDIKYFVEGSFAIWLLFKYEHSKDFY